MKVILATDHHDDHAIFHGLQAAIAWLVEQNHGVPLIFDIEKFEKYGFTVDEEWGEATIERLEVQE